MLIPPAEPNLSKLPRDFYNRRAGEVRFEAAEVAKRKASCNIGLFLLGALGCFLIYQSFYLKKLPLWTPVAVVPFALYVGQRMKHHHREAAKLIRLADYYDAGLARLDHKWEALEEGQEFTDPEHFYAADLDLFGNGSLFQLLCSARTQAGRETLANWMKKPASKEEVLERHAAISELRDRRDLREALATAGSLVFSNCRPETFRTWLASSVAPFPSAAAPIALLLALAVLSFPILYGFGVVDFHSLWLRTGAVVVVEMCVAAIFLRRVRSIDISVRPLSIELPIVCEILEIVGRKQFTSARLIELENRTKEARIPIARLRRLLNLLRVRDNPYSAYFSFLLMWATQFTMAIDRWRRRHGTQMREWLAAVGELDALISLSAYAYEHPLDIFPELLDAGPAIEAEGLGHPLLRENACVRNDFRLGGDVRFLIVSGSNMSGKSTFVRAIGLNAVLAWIGAPVRCTKLSLSWLTVGASVRVQDSVIDGRSHFLAEMQRLRRMIDVASETPLLYLTDEIMSGTNSQDRRIATEWVVRALVLRGAVGIITTHDLALTEIASNGLPGRNAHFEDTGEAGNLTFDYKLRPGVLTHSNALNIAHMLGIDTAAS
jgi:hypothetical protein